MARTILTTGGERKGNFSRAAMTAMTTWCLYYENDELVSSLGPYLTNDWRIGTHRITKKCDPKTLKEELNATWGKSPFDLDGLQRRPTLCSYGAHNATEIANGKPLVLHLGLRVLEESEVQHLKDFVKLFLRGLDGGNKEEITSFAPSWFFGHPRLIDHLDVARGAAWFCREKGIAAFHTERSAFERFAEHLLSTWNLCVHDGPYLRLSFNRCNKYCPPPHLRSIASSAQEPEAVTEDEPWRDEEDSDDESEPEVCAG